MKKLGSFFAYLNQYNWFKSLRKFGLMDRALLTFYDLLVSLRGREIVVDMGNYSLTLDRFDQTITKTYLLHGGYEEFSKRYILENLHFTRFIDVGANIGDWSVCLKTERPNIEVLAFEPHPDIYNILITNIKRNKLEGVNSHNIGIGRSNGVMNLYCNPNNYGDNSLLELNPGWNKHEVNINPLSSFVDYKDSSTCLLKLDVQGYEFQILDTCDLEWLNRSNILLELDSNYDNDDLFNFIKRDLEKGRRIDVLLADAAIPHVDYSRLKVLLETHSYFDILLWRF